ncbi:MAG: hypothetical protein U9P00_04850 [Pseudomonadota bacterium]|nr:hypothetical protein [Pseudomonadota bacterium]
MTEARVVDTNVLIVASAADDGSPFRPDATPVQEAELRQQVLDWLIEFEGDAQRHAVLDWDWLIVDEYQNKLTEQDYGFLAMMAKRDRNEVIWVGLNTDAQGDAVLEDALADAVTDRADRKMVAAVIAACAQQPGCKLTNACDTDWLDCADALDAHGVVVEHLIGAWLRTKWQTRRGGA